MSIMLALPSMMSAQATRIESDTLCWPIRLAQEYGRVSSLGVLTELPFAHADREVRYWSGFHDGLARVLIVREREGRWTMWRGKTVRRATPLPVTPSSDASANSASVAFLRNLASGQDVELRQVVEGDISASTWRELVDSGLLDVTSTPPDGMVRTGGTSTVIETRVGDHYRAIWVERQYLPIGDQAWRRQALLKSLNRLLAY